MAVRSTSRKRGSVAVDGAWAGGRITERATASLPQGGDDALFSIVGRVLLVGLIGEVTTVIGGANASLIKYNPTGTGADTDLCAAVDIDSDAVGTFYSISGVVADDLLEGIREVIMMSAYHVLEDGDIELECAGSVTGAIRWTAFWIPLEAGASLVAA